MFIPTSVWQQSLDLKFGVFEIIEADMLLEMMKDMFNTKLGIQNNYILDPFSIRIQLAFRNSYDMLTDDYKYRIAVVNDKIRLNINPTTLVDTMRFAQYYGGQTYIEDLQRYRPLMKIQTFIDIRKANKGRLPPDIE